MKAVSKRRTVIVGALLMCAIVGGLVIIRGTPRSGASAIALDSQCASPGRALVASGSGPDGATWMIMGELRNNNSCRSRLLKAIFHPFGRQGPSWSGGYEIQTGSSISPQFPISAQNLVGRSRVAFSGIAGSDVSQIEALTAEGKWITIRPMRSPTSLRKRYPWLRNLTYFMQFLPLDDSVQFVRVRDAEGRIIFKGREALGAFEGSLSGAP